tara:strand:- start:148348 stop:150024 length:1677 start_codon:yes stop_codon:yes gene_type:complete
MQAVNLSGTGLLILIAGSASLLLWGARMTRTGMTRAFGRRIGLALSRGTSNRYNAFLIGLVAASVLQSSTAVGVLSASFASSGAISIAAGLAIMLGADVGSALVAQLLALKIYQIWPVLFFAGYVVHAVMGSRNLIGKQAGRVLMGLGCIFLSLNALASAAAVVQESDLVHSVLAALASEPVIAFLFAAGLTWLAHSSLAILLLLVVLASSGVLGHDQLAFYLVLGINAGAGLPALVLGLSEQTRARRILVGNFLIRLVSSIAAAMTLGYWAGYLTAIDLSPGQQLIFLHVGFNVLLAVFFLWLTAPVAGLLKILVPEPSGSTDPNSPRYLDPAAKEIPDLALSAAARETIRMVGVVEQMLSQSIDALKSNDLELCAETTALDDKVDRLYQEIKFYLIDFTQLELQNDETRRTFEVLSFAINLEHAGDVVVRSLLPTIKKKIRGGEQFSEAGFQELMDANKHVGETIHLASRVFMEKRVADAQNLLLRKEKFREIENQSIENHFARLAEGAPEAIATTSYHMDILRDLKRINSLFVSCAYPLLENAGYLQESRLRPNA